MAHPHSLPGVSRWQAVLAALLIGASYAALPEHLRVGPSWLPLLLIVLLLAPLLAAHRRGAHDLAHWLGRALTGLITLLIGASTALLVARVPGQKTAGSPLLRDAALLWGGNILLFALWYWEIDGGGPGHRHFGHYQSRDFAWPQFQQDPRDAGGYWMPDFLDYLFLAFNTSTAFSPTDTLILSRRAKLLLMLQSLISLTVLAVLAARAINTL